MSKKPHHPDAAPRTGPATAEPAEAAEAPAGAAPAPPDPAAELAKKLAAAEDRHLHLAAEFENYKKRTRRENEDFRKYANEAILREMLGVLDNFDLAIKHIADADQGIDRLHEGVELIHKQFMDVMDRFGVKEIPAHGERFDPNVHQAVSQIDTADVPDGHVAEAFRKGYFYKERVLRPAMVVVGRNKG
ncbi:MAG: nucleotide exchange factor GrpE [Nitrospirae bacterium]|nr:nucleotide exchange factor GrpE [Nitrospirota bacterium]